MVMSCGKVLPDNPIGWQCSDGELEIHGQNGASTSQGCMDDRVHSLQHFEQGGYVAQLRRRGVESVEAGIGPGIVMRSAERLAVQACAPVAAEHDETDSRCLDKLLVVERQIWRDHVC